MRKTVFVFFTLFWALGAFAQFPFPQSKDVVDENGVAYYQEPFTKNWSIEVDGGMNYLLRKTESNRDQFNGGVGLGITKFWTQVLATQFRLDYNQILKGTHVFNPSLRVYADLLQLDGYKNYEESGFWRIMPFVGTGYSLAMTKVEGRIEQLHSVTSSTGVRFQRQFNHILGAYIEPSVTFGNFYPDTNVDFLPCVRLGLHFNLSGWNVGFRRAKIYSQMEVDDLNMGISEYREADKTLKQENEKLKKENTELQKRPKDCPEVAVEPTKVYIGFPAGSAVIPKTGLAALRDIRGSVMITGYADVRTGTHELNMDLSRRRAEAAARVLEDNGARVEIQYKGDTEQPFDENDLNRVVIIESMD